MPIITVKDPNSGKTVKFRWDSDSKPTDADLQEIFNSPRVKEWKKPNAKQSDKSEKKESKPEQGKADTLTLSGDVKAVLAENSKRLESAIKSVAISTNNNSREMGNVSNVFKVIQDTLSKALETLIELSLNKDDNKEVVDNLVRLMGTQQDIVDNLINKDYKPQINIPKNQNNYIMEVTKRDNTGHISHVEMRVKK